MAEDRFDESVPTDEIARFAEAHPDEVAPLLALGARSRFEDWSHDGKLLDDHFYDLFPRDMDEADYPFDAPRSYAALQAFGPRAVGFLLRRLANEDVLGCWYAALALTAFPAYSKPIAAALIDCLAHAHGIIRRQVRWTLRAMAPATAEPLAQALRTDPEHFVPLLDALAFQGRRALAVAPALDELRRTLSPERAALVEDTLRELRGPWPVDPERPVPYLGEHARFDARAPADDTPEARRACDLRVWCDLASWFARHRDDVRAAVFDPDGWTLALEVEARDLLDRWQPERIVVARPALELVFYDWNASADVTHAITSDAPVGFTMTELMFKLQRVYDTYAHAHDRIFEGLRRAAPGRYAIHTGS